MMILNVFKKINDAFLDLFLPRRCIYCGRTLTNFRKTAICPECRDIKLFPKIVRDDRFLFTEALGALKYEGCVRQAMINFKFKSAKYYGYTFAERIYSLADSFPYMKTSLMCCVPISKSRRRPYNQTEVIAEQLAVMLGVDFVPDLLYKARDIRPLSKMNKAQRKFSVRGAFDINPFYDIFGKDVLVIDDIFTSGSTADECARILRSAGAARVYIVCACYD